MLVLVIATIIIVITFTTVKNKQDFIISEFTTLHQKKKIIDGEPFWLKIDFQPCWIASFMYNAELYL